VEDIFKKGCEHDGECPEKNDKNDRWMSWYKEYEERLKVFSLTTLEMRATRGVCCKGDNGGVYSFGNRVCDQWNKLPAAVASSQGINTFKSKLEKYLRNMGGI